MIFLISRGKTLKLVSPLLRIESADYGGAIRVKLLFDQNLSYKLAHDLADLFPDSTHVREVSLQEADDSVGLGVG